MSGQSPVRSINIAIVLSQSLGIGDFTSGSKLVTSISDMLDQKEVKYFVSFFIYFFLTQNKFHSYFILTHSYISYVVEW